jgi:hypothetical protein
MSKQFMASGRFIVKTIILSRISFNRTASSMRILLQFALGSIWPIQN